MEAMTPCARSWATLIGAGKCRSRDFERVVAPLSEIIEPRHRQERATMSVRAAVALTRASWRTAKSYRVSFVLSFASLLVTIVPVYFVANALQPFMASRIAEEGRE
jgi:hypothetical protein